LKNKDRKKWCGQVCCYRLFPLKSCLVSALLQEKKTRNLVHAVGWKLYPEISSRPRGRRQRIRAALEDHTARLQASAASAESFQTKRSAALLAKWWTAH